MPNDKTVLAGRRSESSEEAATEGRHLYRCFVGEGAVPMELLSRYELARRVLGLKDDALTNRLVAASADLASVEMVRRRREPGNGLTSRALLLLSLAETRPEHTNLFLLDQPSVWRGWLAVATAPLFASYQWVKGTLLLWWHARGL